MPSKSLQSNKEVAVFKKQLKYKVESEMDHMEGRDILRVRKRERSFAVGGEEAGWWGKGKRRQRKVVSWWSWL